MLKIQKAKRYQKKAKIALIGPSGSGKTYTALQLAAGLKSEEGKILVLDTERSSATLYADVTDFDHADLPNTRYETFIQAINQAKQAGYEVLIIDSASHAWEAFLEMHEAEAARVKNSFAAWSKVTPLYNDLINAIVSYPGHCIVTMRAKTEYVIEKNEKGKDAPKKIGLAAVMRPGVEYEFDVVGLVDLEHNMTVEKTRFSFLADKMVKKPGADLGIEIREWLKGGAEPEAAVESEKSEPAPAPKSFYNIRAVPREHRKKALTICQIHGAIWDADTGFYVAEKPLPNLDKYRVTDANREELEKRAEANRKAEENQEAA